MSSDSQPAGWHVDPQDPTHQRYWNGAQWTAHRTPITGPLPTSTYVPPAVAPNSSGATTALVLGVLSLLCFGALSGIPAMIVARKATREIDESQGRLGGRGMATAGFVTGLIGTLVTTIATLAVLGVFALGGVVDSTFETTCSTIDPDPFSNPECFE